MDKWDGGAKGVGEKAVVTEALAIEFLHLAVSVRPEANTKQ